MKIIVLLTLVFAFVYMPFMVLDTLVMPELLQLQQTYANAEAIAQAAAGK